MRKCNLSTTSPFCLFCPFCLVFFYSDNGAFMLARRGLEVASNGPLRDGGVTCWEGGIRVAALARWPGHIAPGKVVDQALWSPDLFVAWRQSTADRFSLPTPLTDLNTAADERDPWLSPDGTRFYFASDRGGGGLQIYEASASRQTR